MMMVMVLVVIVVVMVVTLAVFMSVMAFASSCDLEANPRVGLAITGYAGFQGGNVGCSSAHCADNSSSLSKVKKKRSEEENDGDDVEWIFSGHLSELVVVALFEIRVLRAHT